MALKCHTVKNGENRRKNAKSNLISPKREYFELNRPIQTDDNIYVGYSQSRKEKEVLS